MPREAVCTATFAPSLTIAFPPVRKPLKKPKMPATNGDSYPPGGSV
jgi:hypothetical protein